MRQSKSAFAASTISSQGIRCEAGSSSHRDVIAVLQSCLPVYAARMQCVWGGGKKSTLLREDDCDCTHTCRQQQLLHLHAAYDKSSPAHGSSKSGFNWPRTESMFPLAMSNSRHIEANDKEMMILQGCKITGTSSTNSTKSNHDQHAQEGKVMNSFTTWIPIHHGKDRQERKCRADGLGSSTGGHVRHALCRQQDAGDHVEKAIFCQPLEDGILLHNHNTAALQLRE